MNVRRSRIWILALALVTGGVVAWQLTDGQTTPPHRESGVLPDSPKGDVDALAQAVAQSTRYAPWPSANRTFRAALALVHVPQEDERALSFDRTMDWLIANTPRAGQTRSRLLEMLLREWPRSDEIARLLEANAIRRGEWLRLAPEWLRTLAKERPDLQSAVTASILMTQAFQRVNPWDAADALAAHAKQWLDEDALLAGLRFCVEKVRHTQHEQEWLDSIAERIREKIHSDVWNDTVPELRRSLEQPRESSWIRRSLILREMERLRSASTEELTSTTVYLRAHERGELTGGFEIELRFFTTGSEERATWEARIQRACESLVTRLNDITQWDENGGILPPLRLVSPGTGMLVLTRGLPAEDAEGGTPFTPSVYPVIRYWELGEWRLSNK